MAQTTIAKKPAFALATLFLIATGAAAGEGATKILKTKFLASQPDLASGPENTTGEAMEGYSSEATTAAAMEAAITNLVLGKSEMAATPMGSSVAQIADLVKKEMMPKVTSASASDQRQLYTLKAAIEQCNGIQETGWNAALRPIELYRSESRSHKTCRVDEAIKSSEKSRCLIEQKSLHTQKTLKCSAFATVSKQYGTMKNNGMIVRKGGSESVQIYITRISATICGRHDHGTKGQKSRKGGWGGGLKDGFLDKYLRAKDECERATRAFNAKVNECKRKISGYSKKKSICNGIQLAMDSNSCKGAVMQKDSCESYSDCYSAKVAAYKSTRKVVKSQEKDRKAEWRGLKRISCYISAFADGKVTNQEVDTCRKQSHSTALLDITYPRIPRQQVCTVTELYPATGVYKKAEFVPLPALAKGLESQECSGVKEISTTPAVGSPDECVCSRVHLNGYYSAGPLVKCTNCLDVRKVTQKNSCPAGTKIFSPASLEDWKTFAASAGPLNSPNWIIDITKAQNGGGGTRYAMNSGNPRASAWHTSDGSPWWLRSITNTQPTGNYNANCYMKLVTRRRFNVNRLNFDDNRCRYHSKSYYCQPKNLDLTPKAGSPRSCKCTKVELTGSYSAETLVRCENCLDVSRSTQKNSCPSGTKLFSPASKSDWQTFLNSAKPLKAPHFIVDVTRPSNGCRHCTRYAMKSSTPQQATWKTSDGSPWWLRSTRYREPNGNYKANCYMNIYSTTSVNDIKFDDNNCRYHSRSYYCQTTAQAQQSSTPGSCNGKDSGCKNLVEGDGDCDRDSDCAAGLKCGTNNCGKFRSSAGWPRSSGNSWDTTDDCCEAVSSQPPAELEAPAYMLMPAGVLKCPAGSRITSIQQCQSAYNVVKLPSSLSNTRGMQNGFWGGVPVDCSVQYRNDRFDQAPHWNKNSGTDGGRGKSGEFRIICTKAAATTPMTQTTSMGYSHLVKGCVSGHNIKKYSRKTVKECAKICDTTSGCVAFEFGVAYGGAGYYKPGDCTPQNSNNFKNCNGAFHNLDLYLKEEAPILSSSKRGPIKTISDVPLTFVGFVNVPRNLRGRVGVMAGSYPVKNNINWEVHNNGKPRLWWNNGKVDWKVNKDVRTGKWTQIAFVVNKAGTQARCYIDGRLVATKRGRFYRVVPKGVTRVADDNRRGGKKFKGEFKCVRLFSSSLSASDIVKQTADNCQASLLHSPTTPNTTPNEATAAQTSDADPKGTEEQAKVSKKIQDFEKKIDGYAAREERYFEESFAQKGLQNRSNQSSSSPEKVQAAM